MWLRTTMLLWVAAASLGLAGIAATAADAQRVDSACDSAQGNVGYKACLADLYKKADRELNIIWKRVLAQIEGADHLTPKQRKAWKTELRQAQRHWVRFKERDCNGAVLYEWWGGSGAGGAISHCLLRHTKSRTTDLKDRYLK